MSAFTSYVKMSDFSDRIVLLNLKNVYFKAVFLTKRSLFVSVLRFCMPTRGSAGRRQTWRRSLRATRPTVSHTKATSSSPRYITSLPTVRPAPSLCGTSSSRLRRWSVAAATSSATRTTSTKRRMLLLLAKVICRQCCSYWGTIYYTQNYFLIITDELKRILNCSTMTLRCRLSHLWLMLFDQYLMPSSYSKLRCDLCPGHAPVGPDPRWAEEMDWSPWKKDSQDPTFYIFQSLSSFYVHSLGTKPVLPQEP